MERIPRAEGEEYSSRIAETDKGNRYDVDVRFEIEPSAAMATQFTLMREMLPSKLSPYQDILSTEDYDKVFTKWINRYGDYFGILCQKLPSEGDEWVDLVSHIQNQDITEAIQGRTTLTPEEINTMSTFLENASEKAGKAPLFTDEELEQLVKQYLH